MKKKLLMLLILGFTIMLLPREILAATTVKIGPLLPLTGPLAMAGQTVKKVMTFAVEEVNAQGGIKSLGGATLELVFGDTQSKPDIAISEVERLVEKEKVEKEQPLPSEVKIKLKKDGKDSYSWELTGSDVDQILKVNEKLRKQLGGEQPR